MRIVNFHEFCGLPDGTVFSYWEPWSRKQAEAFVNGPGWAPSMVMDAGGFRSGVEALADQK